MAERPTTPMSDEAALALYRELLIVRRTEEQLARSYAAGLIHGACHTYVGEEAIAVGVCAHLRPDDAVFSTHRGHGHAGVPPANSSPNSTGGPRLLARAAAVCTSSRPKWDDGHQQYRRLCILQAYGCRLLLQTAQDGPVGVAFRRRRGQQRATKHRPEPSGACGDLRL